MKRLSISITKDSYFKLLRFSTNTICTYNYSSLSTLSSLDFGDDNYNSPEVKANLVDFKESVQLNYSIAKFESFEKRCDLNPGSEIKSGFVDSVDYNDLSGSNLVQLLDDVFRKSFNAAFSLYFFRLLGCCGGFEDSIRAVCRMMHILVYANKNYRVVDLILYLNRDFGSRIGEEEFMMLMIKLLYETHWEMKVLETIYSMLVNYCVWQEQVSLAFKLIDLMKVLNLFPRMSVCNSLIRVLLRTNRSELVWGFLEAMHGQGTGVNSSIVSVLVHRYCVQGSVESAMNFLVQMKRFGIELDVVLYTIVINSLCKMSCLREATSLLFKMIHLGVSPDSVLITSVIDSYCKVGKLEEAISISRCFNLRPNVFVYNSFISKACSNGNMLEASKLFHEMYELGLRPDCYSYTTLIDGYCKVRDRYKAFQYLGKMLKCGIKPSVVTYTLLIDSYCKSGDVEMAEDLFQYMISDGLVPDIAAYNCLLDGYGKKGLLHKAFEFLDFMRRNGMPPDVVTYNILINGLVARGYMKEVQDILDELVRRGFSPDVVTFTNVVDGYSKSGDLEEAYMVWMYMSERGIKPDIVTCSALINGYCKSQRMDEANALFRKMLDAGLTPDLILYNTLIHGFCCAGNLEDACKLLSAMIRDGILPNEVTYQALVIVYEKKRFTYPEEIASVKLREILISNDIHVDEDKYKAIVHRWMN